MVIQVLMKKTYYTIAKKVIEHEEDSYYINTVP